MAESIIKIARSMIHEVPGFNARLTYKGIPELATDIKKNGLINPVTVRKSKDGEGYELLCGHRRMRAITLLEWEYVDASVKEVDDKEAVILNATENLSRQNLTPYELAQRCKYMRDTFEMSGHQIAGSLGEVSKGYVNNLLRIVDNVHPSIIGRWSEGDGMATIDFLATLAKLEDHAAQLSEWNKTRKAIEGLTSGNDNGGDGEGSDEDPETKPGKSGAKKKGEGEIKRKPKRPSFELLDEARTVIKKASESGDLKKVDPGELALSVLRFAAGGVKRIHAGDFEWDPRVDEDPRADKPDGKPEPDKKAKAKPAKEKPEAKAKPKAKGSGKAKSKKTGS